MRYVDVACRLLLVVVFVVAVFNKVSGRSAWLGFVQSLRLWRAVPDGLVRSAAVAAVAAETLVAVLLVVPVRAAGVVGFALAAGLLLVFTAVIGLTIARGNRTPCRCFGASNTPLGLRHVIRNVFLVCVAVLGLLGATAAGPLDVPFALLLGVCGLVVGVLITAMDDIVALFVQPGPAAGRTRSGARR